jgi:hypothetical protein
MKLIRNLLLLMFFSQMACKKPYDVPAINVNYGYLVVEGNIEMGLDKTTTIHLSRTQTLKDTSISRPELSAKVQIESNAGNVYPLTEITDGTYSSNALQLNSSQQYRIKIVTSNADVYVSAFVKGKSAPEIDSVTWKQDVDLSIYVHTHDPSNNTHYYKWEFEETAQYHAPIESGLGVKNGLIFNRDSSTQVYNCWTTTQSNTITIASTTALSADVVSYQQIQKIFINDPKLVLKYSINVRQYAISQEAYHYWQILQKSTQQTGSIFDPQPAQISGNISCVNHPEKIVLGFIGAGTYTEKRIFISNTDLSNWLNYLPYNECTLMIISQNPNNYLIFNYEDTSYSPLYFVSGGGIAVYKTYCLDCTRGGGSSVKPTFWK